MAEIGYRLPKQYKHYFCACGKKLKYSSQKQMEFVLAMHRTSNQHRQFTGWPFSDESDPLRNYESFPIELNNTKFEKQLRETFS